MKGDKNVVTHLNKLLGNESSLLSISMTYSPGCLIIGDSPVLMITNIMSR